MPREITEAVGEPFFCRQREVLAVPAILKAIDISDLCPPLKYGGRMIICYAPHAGERLVAFVAASQRDYRDGVCSVTSIEKLTGDGPIQPYRQQIRDFARPLGLDPGVLVEMAIRHQPVSG